MQTTAHKSSLTEIMSSTMAHTGNRKRCTMPLLPHAQPLNDRKDRHRGEGQERGNEPPTRITAKESVRPTRAVLQRTVNILPYARYERLMYARVHVCVHMHANVSCRVCACGFVDHNVNLVDAVHATRKKGGRTHIDIRISHFAPHNVHPVMILMIFSHPLSCRKELQLECSLVRR